jgi:drug/metabolite transporter (DMT)-like permease
MKLNSTTRANRKNKLLPYLALAVTVLATSVGGMFVRWANAPGIVTVFYRTAISTILVAPFFVKNFVQNKQSIKSIAPWIPMAMLGGLLIALDQASWASALLMTKMANTTYFNSLAPLWVALFALLVFKEKLKWIFWAGLSLSLAGTLIILGLDLIYRPHLGPGDLLGLLSSFFYGGYFLVTQIGRRNLDTLTYTWIATLSCAFCLGLINILFNQSIIGYPLESYLFFFGAAITSQVIGYFSLSYALGHLSATIVSPTMLAKPITVALLAFIFFGESLTFGEIIGGILVLIGIFLINKNELQFSKKTAG